MSEQAQNTKRATHAICLRVDDEFLKVWDALPSFSKSEIVAYAVMHFLRCETAKQEFRYVFPLGVQAILWGQKKR